MTVSAQGGVFAFAMQTAKGVLPTYFYRHMAADINYGPVQDLRTFPLEVGGQLLPTGAYKAGVFMGGGATLNPRMENSFGYLLKGLLGRVDSGALLTTGSPSGSASPSASGSASPSPSTWASPSGSASPSASGSASPSPSTSPTAAWQHVFRLGTNQSYLPWMAVRKYVPGLAQGSDLWETGLDNKITSLRLNFAAGQVINARVDFLGRQPDWTPIGAASWANAMEDYTSVPITVDVSGFLRLPDTFYGAKGQVPITQLGLTFANNLTSPQQETIIASPYPDDFVPLSRALSIQATLKWADPQLYLEIMTNTINGRTWSAAPFTSALDCLISSPATIPGSAVKYSIRVVAQRVMWGVNGSPVLAGGDIIMLPLIGTAILPTSGDYMQLIVTNGTESYG
jgi:hypothetical protein